INLSLSNIGDAGLARRNFVPHPNAPTEREAALRVTSGAGLAERINEAKAANEFKRLVGGGNVTRLSETSFAGVFQSAISERALVIAPATAGEAADVMTLAARERFAVIPAGAATFIDSGNVLSRSNLV